MLRSRVRPGEGDTLTLRVEVDGFTPAIWRRVLVSERASLRELHEIIAVVMERDGASPYEFIVDGVRFDGDADDIPRGRAAPAVSLTTLNLLGGARLLHSVDGIAEPWRHVVTVEHRAPRLIGQRVPDCLVASRAAPPEECNGPRGYRELLAHWQDHLDPCGAEWRSLVAEDFDPEYANLSAINAALGRVRKHRPAA